MALQPTSDRWFPTKIVTEKDLQKLRWSSRGDWRFAEPFLFDTVSRHSKTSQERVTELAALLEHFSDPGAPDPAGFIFHLSRCGSTAVSQMLVRDPENMVLSEPGAAEGVLNLGKRTAAERIALFVSAMKAFFACRDEREKRIIVKFSSSDRWLPWIKLAYPRTPWIFIYREPAAVLKSNLESPASWLEEVKENRKGVMLQQMGLQLQSALENAEDAALLVNHSEIDESFPPRLLEAFRIPSSPELLESMKESLQWYSKAPRVRWNADQQSPEDGLGRRKKPVTPVAPADLEVSREVMDLYEELERVRSKK